MREIFRESYSDMRSIGAPDNKYNQLANWLCLAAAPTFAIMALLTAAPIELFGGSSAQMPMPCSAMHGGSPLNGMALMYGLMSIFHAAPWLKLISKQRSAMQRY